MSDRFLRLAEVRNLTGLSATTLWRLEQTGDFPKRCRLGPNCVGWRLTELSDWIDTRPRSAPEKPNDCSKRS